MYYRRDPLPGQSLIGWLCVVPSTLCFEPGPYGCPVLPLFQVHSRVLFEDSKGIGPDHVRRVATDSHHVLCPHTWNCLLVQGSSDVILRTFTGFHTSMLHTRLSTSWDAAMVTDALPPNSNVGFTFLTSNAYTPADSTRTQEV